MNKLIIGNEFEKEIAELYKLMGYEVESNVLIAGQQIDILATKKITGSDFYKVLIECKFKGNEKSAWNEDIQSIAGAYNIARASNLVHNCIVVTNNNFSSQAKQAAVASGIVLKTKQQLIEELIDFSQYFKELLKSYNNDFGYGSNSWYIKNKARRGKEKIECLDTYLEEWLKSGSKKPIVIKGGYGTGKSSFCKHFALKVFEANSGIFPIIIQLRDFQKSIKIESLIRDFLDNKCVADTPRFEVFWRMYMEEKILILFDGFDEMAARVDSTVIEATLIELEKFSKEVGNVIVTCRPEYFISDKEELKAWTPKNDPIVDRMACYDSIDLELWDNGQVQNYIEKRLADSKSQSSSLSVQDFMKALNEVSANSDISSRAVHLDITVKILPYMVENNIPLNRPNLYKSYISCELDREVIKNKRLKIISDEERMELIKEVAYRNFVNSSDTLNFETAARVIQRELSLPKFEIDSVTRDFLNRSFLTRNGDIYQFAHKSLGEYLVASKIYDLINIKDFSFIKDNNAVSSAISGITLELFGGLEQFLYLIDKLEANKAEDPIIYFKKIVFLSLSLTDLINYRIIKFRDSINDQLNLEAVGFMHDILNTISTIKNFSDRKDLWNKVDDNEDFKKGIEVGWKKLVDIILWMSNLDKNNMRIKPVVSEVNVKELISDSILQYDKFNIKLKGESGLFMGDKIIISRIIDNLIKNGIEEIQGSEISDSSVEIIIAEEYSPNYHQLNLKFSNKTRNVIKENFLKKIFDFGYTTKSKGFGIGLYVVKSLVSLHKGTVNVTTKNQSIIFDVNLSRLD